MILKPDCVHFRGDKPCRFRRGCEGCPEYAPFSGRTRVLMIKCRAQGDVLRTTALLPALGRKYPDAHVTWVVDPESLDLLAANPLVDRALPYDLEAVVALGAQAFDVLISLDKEPGLAGLAQQTRAAAKFGFGLNAAGNLSILNDKAGYAFALGVDDDLKFRRNQKTYQEIAAEAAGLDYRRDEYVFVLPDSAKERAAAFWKKRRISAKKPAVGLNTGAGSKFETKQWPAGHYAKLIRLLLAKTGANVFLLGGLREKAFNDALAAKFRGRVFNTGADNSLLEFAGVIDRLDLVVTSDTLGLHLAVALKKKVVALFGSTCPQEIDLYGRGVKMFRGESCAPCYKKTCADGRCMSLMTPESVFAEIRKLL